MGAEQPHRKPSPEQLKRVADGVAAHRKAGRSEDWIASWRRGAMAVITRWPAG